MVIVMRYDFGRRMMVLSLVFLAIFAMRVYFAFQTPDFVDDYSYFFVSQVESIRSGALVGNVVSVFDRDMVSPPVFTYLAYLASLVWPLQFVAKIGLNLIAASVVFFTYAICVRVTHDDRSSILAAALAGLIPSFISLTFSSLTPYAVLLPLYLLLIWLYLSMREHGPIKLFVAGVVLLSFLHPFMIIFAVGLIFYHILQSLDGIGVSREEAECSFFAILFMLWSQLLLYKDVLLLHGASAIWQNVPKDYYSYVFSNFSVLDVLIAVGTTPLALGLFVVIRYLHRIKSDNVNFIMAHGLVVGGMIYLRVLAPEVGFALLGILFALLSSVSFKQFFSYIPSTRFSAYSRLIGVSLVLVVLLFALVPAFYSMVSVLSSNVVSEDMPLLVYMRYELPKDARVVAAPKEGFLVSAVSRLSPVIDSNFLLRKDSDALYHDVSMIYRSPLTTDVIERMERLGATHVLFTPSAAREFDVVSPAFGKSDCFRRFAVGNADVYERLCKVTRR